MPFARHILDSEVDNLQLDGPISQDNACILHMIQVREGLMLGTTCEVVIPKVCSSVEWEPVESTTLSHC